MILKPLLMVLILVTLQVQAKEDHVLEQTVASSKTCQELSVEVETLLSLKNQAAAGFWDIKGNQLAARAGLVFKPAWLYIGYTAIYHFHDQFDARGATKRIMVRRNAMADKLCFVK